MLWQMEHGHNGLGRLDMALFPYYKKDIEEGRLTREKAEVILREMIALIGSQTHQKALHFMEIPDNISFWEVSIKKVGMWRMS